MKETKFKTILVSLVVMRNLAASSTRCKESKTKGIITQSAEVSKPSRLKTTLRECTLSSLSKIAQSLLWGKRRTLSRGRRGKDWIHMAERVTLTKERMRLNSLWTLWWRKQAPSLTLTGSHQQRSLTSSIKANHRLAEWSKNEKRKKGRLRERPISCTVWS